MGGERPVCRGCFFCKSGKEKDVVRSFEAMFPDSKAIAPTRSRYRRVKDGTIEEKTPLLPGYVFFVADTVSAGATDGFQQALQRFVRHDNVLRLLRYTDGSWQLQGYDDAFAKMLFDADGNIGVSQACFDVGKRIRILSGFLKDHEASIVRVNRKTGSVEIKLDFQGKTMSMKLGFELVEPVEANI